MLPLLLLKQAWCTHTADVQVTPARLVCTWSTAVFMTPKSAGAAFRVPQLVNIAVLSLSNTVIAACRAARRFLKVVSYAVCSAVMLVRKAAGSAASRKTPTACTQ